MASVACRLRNQLCVGWPVGPRWPGVYVLILITPAHAQIGSARYSSIVVDAARGDVLEEVNADQPRHPASLTKMMTLYLTFEALARPSDHPGSVGSRFASRRLDGTDEARPAARARA